MDNKRNFNEDRTICDAATAGPWAYDYEMEFDFDDVYEFIRFNVIAIKDLTDEDARFIAEARTGWPAALDEIDRLDDMVQDRDAGIDQKYAEIERLQEENAEQRLMIDALNDCVARCRRELARMPRSDAQDAKYRALYEEYASLTRVLATAMRGYLHDTDPELRALAGFVNDCVLDGNSTIKSEVGDDV